MESITSGANPLLKEVRKAIAQGSLTASGLCIAEGPHLVEEALGSSVEVPVLLVAESAVDRTAPLLSRAGASRVIALPDLAFGAIATTETSQGIMALVRPKVWNEEHLFTDRSLVVVLDGVQDPGNAGAIVRAAEAFGATGVIFLKGTVNPWNPRTIRGSSGSLFRMPMMSGVEPSLVAPILVSWGCAIYAADPWRSGSTSASDADLRRSHALVIGNEGKGIGPDLRAVAESIAIRTESVESLNASVAAAILLYEASRQRQT